MALRLDLHTIQLVLEEFQDQGVKVMHKEVDAARVWVLLVHHFIPQRSELIISFLPFVANKEARL